MRPNNVKSNGSWANNVRPYGYVCACGLHAATINPARNSHPPNPDFHRRTPPARRTRTDTPAIPFSRRVNRPSARCRSAMPPSSGGTGSRLNSPSSALAPASRSAPSGFASAVSAKLAAGPARQMAARENGDGGRLHRRPPFLQRAGADGLRAGQSAPALALPIIITHKTRASRSSFSREALVFLSWFVFTHPKRRSLPARGRRGR